MLINETHSRALWENKKDKKITAACPHGCATVPYVSVMCYE